MYLISTETYKNEHGPGWETSEQIVLQPSDCAAPQPMGHLNSPAEPAINSHRYDNGTMKQGHYLKAVLHFPNVPFALLLTGCVKVICMLQMNHHNMQLAQICV